MFARLNQKFSDALLDFFVQLAEKAQGGSKGQGALEYAVITGLIAAVVVAAAIKYADRLKQWWDRLINSM